jgi:hypothetical protein
VNDHLSARTEHRHQKITGTYGNARHGCAGSPWRHGGECCQARLRTGKRVDRWCCAGGQWDRVTRGRGDDGRRSRCWRASRHTDDENDGVYSSRYIGDECTQRLTIRSTHRR